MNKLKGILVILIVIFIVGCASVSKPPHCDDTGTDLKPINSLSGIKVK